MERQLSIPYAIGIVLSKGAKDYLEFVDFEKNIENEAFFNLVNKVKTVVDMEMAEFAPQGHVSRITIKLKDKKECKSRKKKCIKNLYNKLKITPRGSSRRTSGCTSSRCTSRSISRGSTRGSFLRPSKSARLSKAGSKKLFSLDRLKSKNKKFFSESLPRRKRTLKQKVLELERKNKEYAKQIKEERKYLKGSKKKRRRKKGQK